jgi:hypothetical protein
VAHYHSVGEQLVKSVDMRAEVGDPSHISILNAVDSGGISRYTALRVDE